VEARLALALIALSSCNGLTGSDEFYPGEPTHGSSEVEAGSSDGATDASSNDAFADVSADAIASSPNRVHCESMQCPLSDGRACCNPSSKATCGNCAKTTMLLCDERADCATGQVCCLTETSDGTRCDTACGTRDQICMTDAECGARTCTAFLLGTTTLGRCR